MKNQDYAPEGMLGVCKSGSIREGLCVMCDSAHNLHVVFDGKKGVITRAEAALGIKEGTLGDVAIITRVNKTVCFKEISVDGVPLLSRAAAQRECLEYIKNNYTAGDIVDARITHLEQFGAFCDIGCGIISMIPIDSISVSRIAHPSERFFVGMDVKVVIKDIDRQSGRITVSHKELLGTWEQNAAMFSPGQTVAGIVRSVEGYGVFIELAPNLAGLAEVTPDVCAGDLVSVYIKSVIPDKMKVKLAIVEVTGHGARPCAPHYMYEGEHIPSWRYSPSGCSKVIETIF